MIMRLEEQGRTEDAAALGTWDLPRLEGQAGRERTAADRR